MYPDAFYTVVNVLTTFAPLAACERALTDSLDVTRFTNHG
jgi:hypothetical protein